MRKIMTNEPLGSFNRNSTVSGGTHPGNFTSGTDRQFEIFKHGEAIGFAAAASISGAVAQLETEANQLKLEIEDLKDAVNNDGTLKAV